MILKTKVPTDDIALKLFFQRRLSKDPGYEYVNPMTWYMHEILKA